MFTVALIGPDGAGKTTIGRRLEHTLTLPVRYVYMGVNLESSNLMLPTTRLILELKRLRGKRPDMAGPSNRTRVKPQPKGVLKRTAAGLKAWSRLAVQVSEEWFRQGLAWYYQRRGYIVLFDRHFFSDYYAYDIAGSGKGRPLSSRVHGYLLGHVYPQPDLVIFLDAPAEVLFARKGEATPEWLESRRQEYLQLRNLVKHFSVVDASQPQDDVARDVAQLIRDFYDNERGDTTQPHAMNKEYLS